MVAPIHQLWPCRVVSSTTDYCLGLDPSFKPLLLSQGAGVAAVGLARALGLALGNLGSTKPRGHSTFLLGRPKTGTRWQVLRVWCLVLPIKTRQQVFVRYPYHSGQTSSPTDGAGTVAVRSRSLNPRIEMQTGHWGEIDYFPSNASVTAA